MGLLRDVIGSPCLPLVIFLSLVTGIQIGTIKALGIFTEDITRSLGMTSSDIGTAVGLYLAFMYLPSPIIPVVYHRWRYPRIILIAGSLLATLSITVASLAQNNVQLAIFLTISGFGQCIVFMLPYILLDELAGDNFNILLGIAASGSAFGMFLLPFLADLVLRSYDWRGGMLVFGALTANTIPSALAVQTPSIRLSPDSASSDQRNSGGEGACQGQEGDSFVEKEKFHLLAMSKSLGPDVLEGIHCHESIKRAMFPESHKIHPSVDDPVSSRGLHHIKRIRERLLKNMCTSDFYQDPCLNIMILAETAAGFVYIGWHTFLLPHAMQRGISVDLTVIVAFCAALGNLAGRASAGVIANSLYPLNTYLGVTVLNIASLLCDAFVPNLYVMLLTSCLSSFCVSGRAILGILTLRDRCSPCQFPTVVSTWALFFGLAVFSGGYLTGKIADIFSTYDATFKLLAVIDATVFCLMLPPKYVKKTSTFCR